MGKKILVRYIILMILVCLCAAAAWYLLDRREQPAKDAVLVKGKWEAIQKESTVREVNGWNSIFCI